jgi:DNA-binding XRE family transcriptional regulator
MVLGKEAWFWETKGATMLIKELHDSYDGLSDSTKSTILALSILINRIGQLSKPDRDDLFDLLQEWRKASSQEEQRSIRRAMEEILAQTPLMVKPMLLNEEKPVGRGLKGWKEHVGRTIREFREKAGWTQAELAEKAGLPQSHVSRLENAAHSPTNMTLEKIAKALKIEVGKLDPCAD